MPTSASASAGASVAGHRDTLAALLHERDRSECGLRCGAASEREACLRADRHANAVGIDAAEADVLPEQKAEVVKRLRWGPVPTWRWRVRR